MRHNYNYRMVSADLNRMYAHAREEQQKGRDAEREKREQIEADVARFEAERIKASEESVRRKHKRRLKLVCLGEDPDHPGDLKLVKGQGRQIGEPRRQPIEFERKVKKFVELYQSIPADQRLHGSDGDSRFDFWLNKHILADMYAKNGKEPLKPDALRRVMLDASKKF